MIQNEFSIQTLDHFFDYETPSNSTMTLEELVNSLSNICRWAGHVKKFFSVAQHACLVHDIILEGGGSSYQTFLGLHHDDHEAVRGDIPTPRKRFLKKHNMLFPGEEKAEDEWIYGTLLGVEWPPKEEDWKWVKWADKFALETERAYLKPFMKWHAVDKKSTDIWSRQKFQYYWDNNKDWRDEYLDRHDTLVKKLENEKNA